MPVDWSPPDHNHAPQCDRCNTHVSQSFHRVFSNNKGYLDGCRHCLPRSVRWGMDVYGRDKDKAEQEYVTPDS